MFLYGTSQFQALFTWKDKRQILLTLMGCGKKDTAYWCVTRLLPTEAAVEEQKEPQTWSQETYMNVWALSFTCCVTLGMHATSLSLGALI